MPELNYHIRKFFTEKLLAIEMRKIEKIMNKPAFLELSTQELSKMLMLEFCYNYLYIIICYKLWWKTKLKIDSFIVHIKAKDIYKDIPEDVESRFDTSSYKLDRPLPKFKN